MLVMVPAPVLIVVAAGMPAVVATFMPAVPAIPVLFAVNAPVTVTMPIMMLTGVPSVMPVVVLGANTTRRADDEQDGARQRYRYVAIPPEDVMHAKAPLVWPGGGVANLPGAVTRDLAAVSINVCELGMNDPGFFCEPEMNRPGSCWHDGPQRAGAC